MWEYKELVLIKAFISQSCCDSKMQDASWGMSAARVDPRYFQSRTRLTASLRFFCLSASPPSRCHSFLLACCQSFLALTMLTRHILTRLAPRACVATSRALGTAAVRLRGGISKSLSRDPTSSGLSPASFSRRYLSFSFAGPRALDEIIKKELLESKTGAEIADIWYSYHESRVSWLPACILLVFARFGKRSMKTSHLT